MTNYLLGIDVGTGGSKALLIDAQGSVAANVTTEYPLSTPQTLWSEQNPQDWYNATVSSIAKVLEQSAINPSEVTAIGLTHSHIDHVGGNAEVMRATGAELICHRAAEPMLDNMVQQGQLFGLDVESPPKPDRYIHEGDEIVVGATRLGVVNVPGHAPGHIALVGDGFIIGGDVLFAGSIGRTDLPGGSFETLIQSIRTKFLCLPDETVVHCGHGPSTTIGAERKTNPFLATT